MGRERDELEAAHRAQLRRMGEARREAERVRARSRYAGPEACRAAESAFRAELARLDAEHRAWLRAHLPADELPGERTAPRSRRMGPLG